jgi:hypothetical protein
VKKPPHKDGDHLQRFSPVRLFDRLMCGVSIRCREVAFICLSAGAIPCTWHFYSQNLG